MTHGSRRPGRRSVLAGGLLALVLACTGEGCAPRQEARSGGSDKPPAQVLHIGHQKADTLNLLRLRGDLDRRLEKENVRVEWTEFPAGPPLLEGLGVGSIDLGSTGESPAIFAQAAGTPIVYVANIPNTSNNGDGQALLVPHDSPVKSLADLKGKRIAVARGSGAHNFLIQVLQRAGVDYKEIKPVFLAPPDARAAFDGGRVDGWAIWDPYLAVAQRATGARVLVNARGIISPGPFYLSSRTYAAGHLPVLRAVLEEVERTSAWSQANPEAAADLLSKKTGVDKETLLLLAKRRPRGREYVGLRPITDAVLAEQQQVADNYYRIGLLPQKVDVRQATLTPQQYAAIKPEKAPAPSVKTASAGETRP